MPNPISHERADFIRDRLRVLNAMIMELTSKPAKYYSSMSPGGNSHVMMQTAMSNIQAEKIQLLVELEVLMDHLS